MSLEDKLFQANRGLLYGAIAAAGAYPFQRGVYHLTKFDCKIPYVTDHITSFIMMPSMIWAANIIHHRITSYGTRFSAEVAAMYCTMLGAAFELGYFGNSPVDVPDAIAAVAGGISSYIAMKDQKSSLGEVPNLPKN